MKALSVLALFVLSAACDSKPAAPSGSPAPEIKNSGTPPAQDPTVVKIVSSLPRTGSAKAQTDTIVNGIQMAFDEAVNRAVYATGVYASRGANPTSNLADGIFSDSLSAELVTPSGEPTGGYAATFRVAVAI